MKLTCPNQFLLPESCIRVQPVISQQNWPISFYEPDLQHFTKNSSLIIFSDWEIDFILAAHQQESLLYLNNSLLDSEDYFCYFFFFWDGSHHLMLLLIKHFFMTAPTYTIRLHDQPALTLGFSSLLLYFFFLVKRWWKHLVSSVWISLLVYKNCV